MQGGKEMNAHPAKTGRVSCLGPNGSYSELAAMRMCGGQEIVLCHSFNEAVKKLLAGETDHAVLPVENSLNGGVNECLDLLEEEDIFGVDEYLLPIDHRIALLEGVSPRDIRFIYSHTQAIGQCLNYLAEHFPNAECRETASTAESLSRLDGCSAGIVGAHMRREGVVLSPENIADNRSNFTRFLLVERKGEIPKRSAMIFCCFICKNSDKPGALLGLLKIFLKRSINLTRIESRPVKGEFGKYRFFIEFAGDIGTPRIREALEEVRRFSVQYKLLGAYH